ncbi:phosphate transport system protein [Halohasta litchfieldiae]|jgi:phosphate uptake regulator, PhoU|uniref:Phosphate-specific transport system accessory protein PhoU n=1 Tax=Halohasta litchfieldiae TaxID=1073996 RepID=A0A1H6RK72_9EURY|nr:phosphate signaling complex protein PhoU [Halohasta litchfieldiae]ATW89773.1 phosphate transport system protein [Halohasta litchfieldiae]SEI52927.1 phosphate uptake regulator, PhoU [Halohasta litchfieldiae]
MPRNEYQSQLADLRSDVLEMSDTVAERLEMALNALETNNHDLAQQVIDGDSEINQQYLELEKQCTDLIALQQPVAGDLRFIAASFKIITDLERIADLATNLGEYATAGETNLFPDIDLQELGSVTLEMLDEAMAAYADDDREKCYTVDERDDDLDYLCEVASDTVVRELIESEQMDSDEDIEAFMEDVSRFLLTIRDIERIGDHSVNIAARALYMIDNNDELIY